MAICPLFFIAAAGGCPRGKRKTEGFFFSPGAQNSPHKGVANLINANALLCAFPQHLGSKRFYVI